MTLNARTFTTRRNAKPWSNQPQQIVAPLQKAAPSEMNLDFPGTVEIVSAEVVLFDGTPEAHIKITALMGNALVTSEVGRLSDGTGRLLAESVSRWTKSHGLVFLASEQKLTNHNESITIVQLVTVAVKTAQDSKVALFKA